MRFSTYAALISVATAIEYCDENKACAEDTTNVCIGRFIKSIENPQKSEYKIALKSDPEMIVKKGKSHICLIPEMAKALTANVKDGFITDNLGVTAKYWTMDNEKDFNKKAKGKRGVKGTKEFNMHWKNSTLSMEKGKGFKNVDFKDGDKYMKSESSMNKTEGWYKGGVTYDAQDGKGEQSAGWSLKKTGDYKEWKWGKSGATELIGSGIALATVAMMIQ